MGRALAQGSTFSSRGIFLKAIFDCDPQLIGKKAGSFEIMDSADLAAYCNANRVDIAVLTVPKTAAASVAADLRGLSVKGIWNFTGEELNIGSEIPVQNVHLGDLLMTLCYNIHARELRVEPMAHDQMNDRLQNSLKQSEEAHTSEAAQAVEVGLDGADEEGSTANFPFSEPSGGVQ